jgi:hypothetical protein
MKNIQTLCFFLLFVCSCNNLKEKSVSPNEVFLNFNKALSAKDFVTAKKYTTEQSSRLISFIEIAMKKLPSDSKFTAIDSIRYTISEAVITNNEAKISISRKETKTSTNFFMKKEIGKWKVEFDENSLLELVDNGFDKKAQSMLDNRDERNSKTKKGETIESLYETYEKGVKESKSK